MKKNIFALAAAVLMLGMTACQKEDVITDIVDNGEPTTSARVKTTSDLIGTDWTYTMNDIVLMDENGDTAITIPSLGDLYYLNFDASYAHFSFGEMVEAWGLSADGTTMEQITGVDYEYSYDGATHTGSLVGTAEDENGNEVTSQLGFTYNDATDEMTFILPMAFEGDTNVVNVPMVFHRTATAE